MPLMALGMEKGADEVPEPTCGSQCQALVSAGQGSVSG